MRKAAARISWWLLVFLAILITPPAAAAQRLEPVGEFDAVIGGGGYSKENVGDLQFVPGGYVIKKEGSHTERYVFRGTRFESLKRKLPPALENWSGPDWEDDVLDKIDLHNPEVKRYLPKGGKLKKVLHIPQDGSDRSLSLICYSLQSGSQVFITGLLDLGVNSLHQGPPYQKLWTRKVREGLYYGDLQYQLGPGGEGFVLVYSGAPGGDSEQLGLDVYRLRWDDQPQNPAKK